MPVRLNSGSISEGFGFLEKNIRIKFAANLSKGIISFFEVIILRHTGCRIVPYFGCIYRQCRSSLIEIYIFQAVEISGYSLTKSSGLLNDKVTYEGCDK